MSVDPELPGFFKHWPRAYALLMAWFVLLLLLFYLFSRAFS